MDYTLRKNTLSSDAPVPLDATQVFPICFVPKESSSRKPRSGNARSAQPSVTPTLRTRTGAQRGGGMPF